LILVYTAPHTGCHTFAVCLPTQFGLRFRLAHTVTYRTLHLFYVMVYSFSHTRFCGLVYLQVLTLGLHGYPVTHTHTHTLRLVQTWLLFLLPAVTLVCIPRTTHTHTTGSLHTFPATQFTQFYTRFTHCRFAVLFPSLPTFTTVYIRYCRFTLRHVSGSPWLRSVCGWFTFYLFTFRLEFGYLPVWLLILVTLLPFCLSLHTTVPSI